MEVTLQDLTSGDTSSRLAALEVSANQQPYKSWLLDVSTDVKRKIMSNAVDAVKDFNPKVALEALNCVEILVRHHKHDFLPLANMTFDVLLGELCDFKGGIRDRSLQVLLELVCKMSIHVVFQHVKSNVSHKNQHVKEGLLAVITRLQDMHGSDHLRTSVSAQTMCTTLSVLLTDAHVDTRHLAVTTLAGLYPTYGEDLVDALARCDLPPAQNKVTMKALLEQRQRAPPLISPARFHRALQPFEASMPFVDSPTLHSPRDSFRSESPAASGKPSALDGVDDNDGFLELQQIVDERGF